MTIALRRLVGAALALVVIATPAAAQSYPNRSITLIVPFAPGGPADVLGRVIGQKRERLIKVGIQPSGSESPQEFAAFVRSQADTRAKVIRAVGIKIE